MNTLDDLLYNYYRVYHDLDCLLHVLDILLDYYEQAEGHRETEKVLDILKKYTQLRNMKGRNNMKRFIKYLFIIFISFSFINNIGAIPSACDGKVINADTYYHEYGYQARVKICKLANCREDGDTGCQFSDTGTAAKWCEGEYTSGGYKGSYHTVRTGKCDTEKIFKCTTCSASGCPVACEIPGCKKTANNDCMGVCYTGSDKLDLNKAKLEKLTDGEIRLAQGTMYGSLSKMEKDGLIRFINEEEKRKIYTITELGTEVLQLELKRIKRLYQTSQEVI